MFHNGRKIRTSGRPIVRRRVGISSDAGANCHPSSACNVCLAPSRTLADGWFDYPLNAASAGVVQVFNPGELGRTDLLRQAIAQID